MRTGRSAGRPAAALAMSAAAMMALAACGSTASPTSGPSAGPSASAGPQTAAAAAGAEGSASPGPAAASADSCTVITQAQAGAALGQAVRPPIRGKATVEGGVACVFYGPDVPAGTSPDIPVADSVRVVLVTGPKARKYFDDYRSKVAARPVAGLGDRAYYDGYASISVLKGDAYLRIAVGTFHNLAAEEKLAADALPRM
jgi:hypothetical protein